MRSAPFKGGCRQSMKENRDTSHPATETKREKIPNIPWFAHLGHDWMDDVVREQEDLGTFTDLPGKGKRLNLKPNFNMVDTIMENNHLLPPWLRLRGEIYQQMKYALTLLDTGHLDDLEQRLSGINQQIAKYNRSCPSPLLQRNLVSVKTLKDACERWSGDA